MDFTHDCLNRLMDIDEEISLLHRERDKERINELRLEQLRIELTADRVLEPIQATSV